MQAQTRDSVHAKAGRCTIHVHSRGILHTRLSRPQFGEMSYGLLCSYTARGSPLLLCLGCLVCCLHPRDRCLQAAVLQGQVGLPLLQSVGLQHSNAGKRMVVLFKLRRCDRWMRLKQLPHLWMGSTPLAEAKPMP